MFPTSVLGRPRRGGAREEFNGSALNPSAWNIVDTEGRITVANGEAAFTPRTANSYTDPLISSKRFPTVARAGDTFECEIVWTSFGTTGLSFGWDIDNPIIDNLKAGFRVNNAGQLLVSYDTAATAGTATPLFITTAVTLALNTAYRFKIVLLAAGAVYSISADGGKTWMIVWVSEAGGYVGRFMTYGFANSGQSFRVRYARWYRGPVPTPALSDAFAARTAPGRADTGQPWLVSQSKPIPVIAGDMRVPPGSIDTWLIGWDGIADGVWEGDLNFGATAGTQKVAFIAARHRDSTDYVTVRFSYAAQQITIVRVAVNVSTTIATFSSAGFVLGTTYRMRVACYGPVIVVYQDGVEKVRGSEAFGQFFGLCSWYMNDNLATPDARWDNVRAWGFPPPPLFADSFDRPDSLLSLGTADTGQEYIPFTDVANIPVFGIESGRAMNVSTGGPGSNDRLARTPALKQAAFLAWAVIRTTLASQGFEGFLLRVLDNQNWVALRVQSSGATNFLSVFKDVAGVRAAVNNAGLAAPLVANQDYVVAIELYGNSYEHWFDGVHVAGVGTLTDFPTNPAAGVYVTSGVSGRIDDLRYVPLGTALVHDTFTRADSALTLGNTELPGTPWLPVFGSVWGINSGLAYGTEITSAARGATVPVLARDLDISCDLTRQNGSIGLMARQDGALNLDHLYFRFDGTNCFIFEKVAGGSTNTLSTTPYSWPASGTARTVRARVFQSVLSIYVNEVLVVAQPFTGHNGPTEIYCGLFNQVSSSNTNRFDNFLVREVA